MGSVTPPSSSNVVVQRHLRKTKKTKQNMAEKRKTMSDLKPIDGTVPLSRTVGQLSRSFNSPTLSPPHGSETKPRVRQINALSDTSMDDIEILRQDLSEREAELAQATDMGNELVKLVKDLKEEISVRDAEIDSHAIEIENVKGQYVGRMQELEMQLKTHRHLVSTYESLYEEGLKADKLRKNTLANPHVFFLEDRSRPLSEVKKFLDFFYKLHIKDDDPLQRAWCKWVSWTKTAVRSRIERLDRSIGEGVAEMALEQLQLSSEYNLDFFLRNNQQLTTAAPQNASKESSKSNLEDQLRNHSFSSTEILSVEEQIAVPKEETAAKKKAEEEATARRALYQDRKKARLAATSDPPTPATVSPTIMPAAANDNPPSIKAAEQEASMVMEASRKRDFSNKEAYGKAAERDSAVGENTPAIKAAELEAAVKAAEKSNYALKGKTPITFETTQLKVARAQKEPSHASPTSAASEVIDSNPGPQPDQWTKLKQDLSVLLLVKEASAAQARKKVAAMEQQIKEACSRGDRHETQLSEEILRAAKKEAVKSQRKVDVLREELRALSSAEKKGTHITAAAQKPTEEDVLGEKAIKPEACAATGIKPSLKAAEQEAPVANEAPRARDSAGAAPEDKTATVKAIRAALKAAEQPVKKNAAAERDSPDKSVDNDTSSIKAGNQEVAVGKNAAGEGFPADRATCNNNAVIKGVEAEAAVVKEPSMNSSSGMAAAGNSATVKAIRAALKVSEERDSPKKTVDNIKPVIKATDVVAAVANKAAGHGGEKAMCNANGTDIITAAEQESSMGPEPAEKSDSGVKTVTFKSAEPDQWTTIKQDLLVTLLDTEVRAAQARQNVAALDQQVKEARSRSEEDDAQLDNLRAAREEAANEQRKVDKLREDLRALISAEKGLAWKAAQESAKAKELEARDPSEKAIKPEDAFTLRRYRGVLAFDLRDDMRVACTPRENGPARTAGVLRNDTVISVNGMPVPQKRQLVVALRDCLIDESVEVVVKRGSDLLKLNATAGTPSLQVSERRKRALLQIKADQLMNADQTSITAIESVLNDLERFESICRQCFDLVDKNRSNSLDKMEVRDLVSKVCTIVGVEPPISEDVDQMMDRSDLDTSGTLTYNEFPPFMRALFEDILHQLNNRDEFLEAADRMWAGNKPSSVWRAKEQSVSERAKSPLSSRTYVRSATLPAEHSVSERAMAPLLLMRNYVRSATLATKERSVSERAKLSSPLRYDMSSETRAKEGDVSERTKSSLPSSRVSVRSATLAKERSVSERAKSSLSSRNYVRSTSVSERAKPPLSLESFMRSATLATKQRSVSERAKLSSPLRYDMRSETRAKEGDVSERTKSSLPSSKSYVRSTTLAKERNTSKRVMPASLLDTFMRSETFAKERSASKAAMPTFSLDTYMRSTLAKERSSVTKRATPTSTPSCLIPASKEHWENLRERRYKQELERGPSLHEPQNTVVQINQPAKAKMHFETIIGFTLAEATAIVSNDTWFADSVNKDEAQRYIKYETDETGKHVTSITHSNVPADGYIQADKTIDVTCIVLDTDERIAAFLFSVNANKGPGQQVKKFLATGATVSTDTEKKFLGHVAWLVGNGGSGSETDLLCQYERQYIGTDTLPMLDLSTGYDIFGSELFYAFIEMERNMETPEFCPKERSQLAAGMAQDLRLVNQFL